MTNSNPSNLPPKDRDSLEDLLHMLIGASVKYEATGNLADNRAILDCMERIKTYHRHLSTKEMLEARIDELMSLQLNYGNYLAQTYINDKPESITDRIEELRAALTREEPQ